MGHSLNVSFIISIFTLLISFIIYQITSKIFREELESQICGNIECINNFSQIAKEVVLLEVPLGSKKATFFKKGGTFKGNHWFHMGEYYLSRAVSLANSSLNQAK